MEHSHNASTVIGVIFSSFASAYSFGRMTWLGEHRSSQSRCSHESGNWIVEATSGRVAMLRKERPNDPHGKYGELVKIFIITTARSCEFHWTRVRSTTEGSTFASFEWQKMVTIPSFPSPIPSVMRIAIGTISSLLAFLLEQVMKSNLAWLHTSGGISLAKSPSDTTQKWTACKQGSSSTHLPGMIGSN